jgi:hypothetical protein
LRDRILYATHPTGGPTPPIPKTYAKRPTSTPYANL